MLRLIDKIALILLFEYQLILRVTKCFRLFTITLVPVIEEKNETSNQDRFPIGLKKFLLLDITQDLLLKMILLVLFKCIYHT